jgi:hypothetical protein
VAAMPPFLWMIKGWNIMQTCADHDRVLDHLSNIEVQYDDIKKDLGDIKTSINAINTKLAVIDSHDVINKINKLELASVSAVADPARTYWFRVSMGLIGLLGVLITAFVALAK